MHTREAHTDTADTVLAHVRCNRDFVQVSEAQLLKAAVTWADLHPASTDDHRSATVPGTDRELAIAGDGAPGVMEFPLYEFAAAMGMSSDAGVLYVGDAVELAYRLPLTYAAVETLDLPAWKARKIAQSTRTLSKEAAAFVDQHLAGVAHAVGYAQLERLIEEARVRFDPEAAEALRLERAVSRHVTLDTGQVSFDGHVDLHATLDLADAMDLDDALKRGAEAMPTEISLDVRRSLALGDLARRQLALDLNAEPEPGKVKPRQVIVHVHLADAAVARVENTRSPISVKQVREWCAHPDSQVVIKPVIDLTGHVNVAAYEVPDRLKQMQRLLQHHCVFPHCGRRGADHDHIDPRSRGGPTSDANIGLLCRRHHRLKTHGGWSYEKVDATTFVWRSPGGMRYRRDHTGTHLITTDPQP